MKRRALLVILALAVVSASVAAYYRVRQSDDVMPVVTAAVGRGDVVETVSATGKLEAVTTVQVGSQISGVVKALHADFNSRVRKGQVIAELDPSLLQTQVDQADATIARLQADVDRAQVQVQDADVKLRRAGQLSAQQLISAVDLETAETNARDAEASLKAAQAQVVQARAALRQNRVNLDHTIITAPIDGIVISRNVDVGQTVAASMSAPTLFVIANDLARMQVQASIDESDIGQIQPRQRVTFRVDAYPNETFSGVVRQVRLDPVVEQNVVSYLTVIDVPNPELKLKPGMTANVTVEIARAQDALRVPTSALRFRPTPELFQALGGAPRQNAAGRTQSGDSSRASAGRSGGAGDRGVSGANGRGVSGDPAGRARVWLLTDEGLRPVPVTPGISDGANTVVEPLREGTIAEGQRVVTGLAATQRATTTPASGSPLLPRFPGRGAGGGQRAGRGA